MSRFYHQHYRCFSVIVKPAFSASYYHRCFHSSDKVLFPAVPASLVKELREKTGAPMMDCKKALSADGVEGDIKLAMDWLRAKGIAKATSGSDRVTTEGLIAARTDVDTGLITLLEINSETDFVGMNEDFQRFVATVVSTINQQCTTQIGPIAVETIMALPVVNPFGDHTAAEGEEVSTIKDALGDAISSIREALVIKRAENIHSSSSSPASTVVTSVYVHGKVATDILPSNIQMGKIASVVRLTTTSEDHTDSNEIDAIGRKLAMHVVAASPHYLSIDSIPEDIKEKETNVFREQTAQQEQDASNKKPKSPEMIERIIQGKVTKRLGEITLLGQLHLVEEGSPNVQKYLASKYLVCDSFHRWNLGGGTTTEDN